MFASVFENGGEIFSDPRKKVLDTLPIDGYNDPNFIANCG
jgi:hypothetical protein